MSNRDTKPELTLEHLKEVLNESQVQAVTYDGGHLLVVAGAGSGKTRVITHRIAWLIAQGVDPARILAITFTNKAAREMRTRIQRMVPKPPSWMGTFHATCARLLRMEADQIGRAPDFSIYDRDDSMRVARQVLKDMGLTGTSKLTPSGALSLIGRAKNEMVGEDQLHLVAGHGELGKLLAEAYQRYQAQLLANNAMDFDDLLLNVVHLFESRPKVLRRYQQRWQHLFVDEYQDTNLPQNMIVKLLATGSPMRVTAVGDPDQMIYGWRGARIENILEFPKDFAGAEVIKLEHNYRSTSKILNAATALIAQNKLRHEKVLISVRGQGEPVTVLSTADPEEEARRVAGMIEQELAAGRRPAEIAILYRTNFQSRSFEQEFAMADIPFAVLDSVAFFQRKEVKDLRAYLQVLINPQDDEALLRIINKPTRGIGAKTVEKLRKLARKHGRDLLSVCLDEEAIGSLGTRTRKNVRAFGELMAGLRELTGGEIADLIRQIITRTGYLESMKEAERPASEEVIDHFLPVAEQFDREPREEHRLRRFLEHLALVSDADRHDAGLNRVSMMTFHAAKGLEFPVVFITGAEEGILPHERSVMGDDGWADEAKVEEERRLLHVGMTRAEEKLVITWCYSRWVGGGAGGMGPSRFLRELPGEHLEIVGSDFFHEPEEEEPSVTLDAEDYEDAAFESFGRITSESEYDEEGDYGTWGRRRGRKPKKKRRAAAESPQLNLNVGDIVQHPKMGRGRVMAIDDAGMLATADIDFDDGGMQKMILKYSGLVRVS